MRLESDFVQHLSTLIGVKLENNPHAGVQKYPRKPVEEEEGVRDSVHLTISNIYITH